MNARIFGSYSMQKWSMMVNGPGSVGKRSLFSRRRGKREKGDDGHDINTMNDEIKMRKKNRYDTHFSTPYAIHS